MKEKINIAFSPCPNDTYMFAALVNGWIDCGNYAFNPMIEDIEQLNIRSGNESADVLKMSVARFASVSERFHLLHSGNAVGRGCGPLLVGKRIPAFEELSEMRIAVPGKRTTANMLLGMFFPHVHRKSEIIFSEIENEILKNNFDAGVIIHESRFTYSYRGLLKIADLGELWEQETGMPLPLGCMAVKKSLSEKTKFETENLIRKSIRFAFDHPETVMPYVRLHAQEMDEQVMKQHIRLYVNEFSVDLGKEGKRAVDLILEKAAALRIVSPAPGNTITST